MNVTKNINNAGLGNEQKKNDMALISVKIKVLISIQFQWYKILHRILKDFCRVLQDTTAFCKILPRAMANYEKIGNRNC